MSEIKPKKERRFLKTLGRVGEILVEQVLLKLGSSIIKKIGGKKTLPSILFLFLSLSIFAQFPNTGNKQRLGFQTTGDGLVWRGALSDTASIQPINNQSAWVILDTINLKFYTFDFTSNVWNLVGGGGSAFTQPVDSLFFNVGVPTNNVDTAKMRWDSDLATVVLGLNDNVPNELGFKNFWLVKNQTGSTITKGSIVYANGTVGASGRITVDKFIANGSIDAKYLLGITAHDLTDGEDGYVISFGKIRQVNTDTFAAGAILYPSPTVAGVWTDVEPVAPNIDMPIGFCINSSVNNGTIAIRVASGYKLNELHDVGISSPVEKSSLYYLGGLWRDTTAALLVSDTASMLTNYLRSGVAASTYLTQSNAASTYLPLTGGTLTGGLNGTTGTFTGLNINNTNVNGEGILTLKSYNFNFPNRIQFGDGAVIRREIIYPNSSSNMQFRSYTVGGSSGGYEFYVSNGSTESLAATIGTDKSLSLTGTLGVTGATTLTGGINGNTKFNNGNVSINTNTSSNWTSSYAILEMGNSNTYNTIWGSSNGDGGANSWGQNGIGNNIDFNKYYGNGAASYLIQSGGRLSYWTSPNGAAGAIRTDSKRLEIDANTLTTYNASVFNEGSTDSDFRVESDGNANMVFVDASTDRVGIGTNAPTRTLEVNGTVGVSSNVTANSFIKSGGSFTQFLKADGTVDGNDYLTTSSAGSTYYPKTGGTISGAVTLSTTTATPTSLLGKDGSNVVGEVTTVAQTGLMTRGETTATTGSPSAIFTVTHSLGSTPTSVLVTSAGLAGAEKIIFEVYSKNSTTFSVQAWNYDGTEASSKSVKIFWLAIK